MPDDTDIGGARQRFPTTHWSAVVGARSAEEAERTRSLEALIAAYWKPVYKYIRIRFGRSNEDAKDLTQAFFLRAMEKDFFESYDPRKARFRTFLRTCLDRFLANQDKAERRLKRGGDLAILALDFAAAEGELATASLSGTVAADAGASAVRSFDAEWVRSLFGLAIEAPARLAFEWKFPPFAARLNTEPLPTWVELAFDGVDGQPRRTRLRLAHHGFAKGEGWDQAYDFFSEAWPKILAQLKEQTTTGGQAMHGEMPKPQDQHKKLQALVGNWTGEEKLYPSPWDATGGSATSRTQTRLDLDGFFVLTDYVEERNGQVAYRGHGVFGWDPQGKCYTMHWFDSMGSGAPEPAKGKWEGNRLVFQMKNPMGHSRYTYTFEKEGRYAFLIENSQDGVKWAPFMEGKYTRKS